MNALVPVTYRDIPLVGIPRQWSAPIGSSILDIVENVPELPVYFVECGFVCVNGEEVPREWWRYVRPREHSVVTLHIRLERGGAGKILASVAAIAVILIAAIAAPAIVAAAGLTGALAAGATAAIGVAGSIGGALLYSALAPPPASTTANAAGPQLDRSVKAAALTGNTLGAGDNLARVLGYRRAFPSFICQPLVELIGIVEVVEGVYGLAGPHLIDHIYVDNVDVATMPEVSTQTTAGFASSIPQTLVNRQGYVVAPNTTLSAHLYDSTNTTNLRDQGSPSSDIPYYHRFVTRTAPDEFWMSLAFAEGLIHSNGNNLGVSTRVRFRIRGTTTWTDCPEVMWRNDQPAALQTTIKLMWLTPPTVLPQPDQNLGAWATFYSTPAQTATPTGGGAFTANSYFYKGSGDTFYTFNNITTTGLRNMGAFLDRVEFYLDPTIFPQASYEVEIRRGEAVQTNNFNPAAYTYNNGSTTLVYDLYGYFQNGSGPFQLLEPQGSIKHKATLIRHSSVWNSPPITAGAPIATIAVKASGRSIQQLSVDAGGYVDQTLGGLPGIYDVSQNPADHYRDVLVGPLGAFPLQTSQIDNLTTWYNDCNSNGYNINGIIQGMKQMDVLKLIAAAGYAKPIQSETWGVAEDKDRTGIVPTQIFTPRNLQNFQWTKAFHPFVDGIRVKYDDATNLYVETEIVVLDPTLQTGGVRLEDIRYDTIVQGGDATRRALFDLKQARERLEFYSGTADIENLVCRVGDLVAINQDMLSSEVGYARIISITKSGSNIIGLTFDDSVPGQLFEFLNTPFNFFNDPTLNFFNKPPRTGVVIRCSDGTFLVKEVSTVDPNLLCLLHFDGPNGSTTFTDSTGRHTFTIASDSPTIDTSQFEFGGSSLHCPVAQIISEPSAPDFQFNGATDFTIDFWVRPTLTVQENLLTLDGTGGAQVIYIKATTNFLAFFDTSIDRIAGGTAVTANVWHHIALVRQSSVLTLYLDGVSQGTNNDGGKSYGGQLGPGGNFQFNGWLDEIRVKNVALWTANFTPPTGPASTVLPDPTAVSVVTPFADPGTIVKNCLVGFGPLGTETQRMIVVDIKPKKDFTADLTFVDEAPDLFAAKPTTLLLHFDGTNGQTTTVDSSSSPTTITMTVATLTTATFKFGTSSCTFNGSSAKVVAAQQGLEFNPQTDFTVDWWFNIAATGSQGALCNLSNGSDFAPWRLDIDSAGANFLFYSASSANTAFDIANGLSVAIPPATGAWHHFAISRLGNFFYFFLDGNPTFSFYSPLTLNRILADPITIGNYSTFWFNGQVDEFRYTNGLARWIASFNPAIVASNP